VVTQNGKCGLNGNYSVSLHWITNWGFFMPENIIPISSHHEFLTAPAIRKRQRVFYLGEHCYSGSPGHSWNTSYWIKRIKKGQAWELYSASEDSPRQRLYSGTFTAVELRQYFDDVHFKLDELEWRSYGLGYAADVLDISEAAYG
jgi:hypothetical protein